MKYYPAFIDLKNKRAVVIGGGKVAERKIRTLINAGSAVKVISPEITMGLQRLKLRGLIDHSIRNYRKSDLKGALIVIAATSSAGTNIKIARDAGGLVNVVDRPSEGNFIVPSTVNRGHLTIAISTDGASPAASKTIRKEIETHYGREFSLYLIFLKSMRKKALAKIRSRQKRERFLKSLATSKMMDELRKRGFSAVSKKILTSLNSY